MLIQLKIIKGLCHKFLLQIKPNKRTQKDQCHQFLLLVKLKIGERVDSFKDQEIPMPQIFIQSQTQQKDPERPMPQILTSSQIEDQ